MVIDRALGDVNGNSQSVGQYVTGSTYNIEINF